MEIEEFLDHHGVKGQKWGVRKNIVGPLGRKLDSSHFGDLAKKNKRRHDTKVRKARVARGGVGSHTERGLLKVHDILKQAGLVKASKESRKAKIKEGRNFVLATTLAGPIGSIAYLTIHNRNKK